MSVTGNLKCQTPYDIFLLLKSSDFINHDLSQLYVHNLLKYPLLLYSLLIFISSLCISVIHSHFRSLDKYVLVLRKWYDLNVSMEFRCFVKNRRLVGTFFSASPPPLPPSLSYLFLPNIINYLLQV